MKSIKTKKTPLDKLDRLEVKTVWLAAILFFFVSITTLFSQKIGDITSIVGVRDNQLIGYGLVVGLSGTGDGTATFTGQTLANFLKSVNIQIDQSAIKSKNVAAVMITANLKPFSKQGDKLDTFVSSIGDAKSLEGGTLLMTPLKGVDGKTYAIAQGLISLGGQDSTKHKTVGNIFEGALVERTVSYDIYNKQFAILSLSKENFNDALAIQTALNEAFKAEVAKAIDPRSIKLAKPKDMSMVEFLAIVKDTDVKIKEVKKIIIDEKTGTIVSGTDIEISPIMITYKNISISIDEKSVPKGQKLTITLLTKALQKSGATAADVIAVLQAIKKAGAYTAKLEII